MFSFNHGVRAISFTIILAVSLTACGEGSPFGGKNDSSGGVHNPEDTETTPTGANLTEDGNWWTGTGANTPATMIVNMSILGVPIPTDLDDPDLVSPMVYTQRGAFGVSGCVYIASSELEMVGEVGKAVEITADTCLYVTVGEPERISWDNLPLVWDQASGMDWGCRREPISLAPGSETTIDCPANAQFDQVMACDLVVYSSYNAGTGQGEDLLSWDELEPERIWMQNGYLPVDAGGSDFDHFQVVGNGFQPLPEYLEWEVVDSVITPELIAIYHWYNGNYYELECLVVE